MLRRVFSTLDPKEVAVFAKAKWRDPKNPLLGFTDLRMEYLRRELRLKGGEPLKGWNALDVGCGGGLVSERLAKLGANVIGVDPTAEAIAEAERYKREDMGPISGSLDYKVGLAADIQGQFDLVVASEVIEHTSNPQQFLRELSERLKPSGHLLLTAPNRSPETYLLLIAGKHYAGFEHMLGLIDPGTHEYAKLLTPEEVTDLAANCGLRVLNTSGGVVAPFNLFWTMTKCTRLGYLMMLRKS